MGRQQGGSRYVGLLFSAPFPRRIGRMFGVKNILIVEDQADVLKLLGVALQHPERKIRQSLSADQAWLLVQEEAPDVILLDIMMPGELDGLDLLQRLRADQRFDNVRVVVISARAQQRDRIAAIHAGADAFIAKPFRLNELKRCIDRLLTIKPSEV
ncbi:MAG: two-component system response regulator [Desulfuromonas sp.]|nr:MAG: two-component system response regulator [Desulfuromonas sp.]